MTDPITRTQLENASIDSGNLGHLMNDAPGNIVARLGRQLFTWAKIQALGVQAAADAVAAASTLYNWDLPHLSILNDPPASPSAGDRYVVGQNPTGAWSGFANRGLYYASGDWHTSSETTEGQRVLIGKVQYTFDGGEWIPYQQRYWSLRPAFVEMFTSVFFGRGMLDDEEIELYNDTDAKTMDQAITEDASAGSNTIVVADNSILTQGGQLTILYDNGEYHPHFITQIGVGVAIDPPTLYPITAGVARCARSWFNRAHPGRYTARHIGQKIAALIEQDGAAAFSDRLNYADFSDTSYRNTYTALGGASLSLQDADSVGTDISHLPRFPLGKTLYGDITADGDGVSFAAFDVPSGQDRILRAAVRVNSGVPLWRLQCQADNGQYLAKQDFGGGHHPSGMMFFNIPFNSRDAKSVTFSFLASSGAIATNFQIGGWDVFKAPSHVGSIFPRRDFTLGVIGDSWEEGLLPTYPEREPFSNEIARRFPRATIVNGGQSGDTSGDLLSRIDAFLASNDLDYLVIECSVNDAYHGVAPATYCENINLMIQKATARNIRVIVLDVPGLAELDDEAPSFGEWELNDAARALKAEMNKRICKPLGNHSGDFPAVISIASPGTGSITLASGFNTIEYEVRDGICSGRALLNVASVSSPTGRMQLKLPVPVRKAGDVSISALRLTSAQTLIARTTANSDMLDIFRMNGADASDTSADYVQANTDLNIAFEYRVGDV